MEFDASAASIGWNDLGEFSLPAGEVSLVVSDRTSGSLVVADAVRWRPRGGTMRTGYQYRNAVGGGDRLAGGRVIGCAPPVSAPETEFRVPVEVEDVGTGTVEDLVVATGNLRPKPES